MLVLAGVSINAIIGDNGVITNAQKANILNSCAILQEFLETQVGTDFDAIGTYENKVDYIVNKYPNYLYKPNASTSFITDSATGFIYYLINKDGLPEDVKKQLVGGDAGEKKYSNYAHFQDVYGVTKDLKVFYCSNGNETRLGAVDEREKDDPTRVVLSGTSNLGSYLKTTFPDLVKTDKDGNVLAENLSSIRSLELNNDTNITSLSGLENLPGLTEIRIVNQTLDNLNGIENLLGVTYVYLENVHITNYSKMSSLENLNTIYMLGVDNTQVANLCSGIADAKFSKLTKLGIFGLNRDFDTLGFSRVGSVSDISGLADLHPETKKAITDLYLNDNYLTDISAISGFTSVKNLRLQFNSLSNISDLSNMTSVKNLSIRDNQITSLNGIQGMSELEKLEAQNNKLGFGIDVDVKDPSNDALSYLEGKKKLQTLNVSNNNDIYWVGYLSNCSALTSLNLSDCLNIKDIVKIANLLNSSSYYDSCYAEDLALADIEKVPFADKTKDYLVFKELFSPTNRTNLKYLSLTNLRLTKKVKPEGATEEQVVNLTASEVNSTLNEVLSGLTTLKTLQLNGITGLSEITFVKTVTGLTELDLRGTMVTTGTKDSKNNPTGLELLNSNASLLRTLALDDTNTTNKIDCKNIVQTVNRLRLVSGGIPGSFLGSSDVTGGLFASNAVIKTLEGASGLDTLHMGFHDEWKWNFNLNLSGISTFRYLNTCGFHSSTITLPSGVKGITHYNGALTHTFVSGTRLEKYDYGYSWKGAPDKSFWLGFFNRLSVVDYVGKLHLFHNGLNYDLTTADGLLPASTVVDNVTFSCPAGCESSLYFYFGAFRNFDVKAFTISDARIKDWANVSLFPNLEDLTIWNNNSRYDLQNLDFLSSLTKLKYLTLPNASISDLSALVDYPAMVADNTVRESVIKFKDLSTINLNGNSIKESIEISGKGTVNNVAILEYINNYRKSKGSSLELYIANNQFQDKSSILSWAKQK